MKQRIFMGNHVEPDLHKEVSEHLWSNPTEISKDLLKRELIPTPEELSIFGFCQEAFTTVFQDLEVDRPELIPHKQLHILPKGDPKFVVNQEKSMDAGYNDGHLFFQRNSLVELAFMACHELSHAYSHHSLTVTANKEQKRIFKRVRHEGMSFSRAKQNDPADSFASTFARTLFMGFNEGVTEQIARVVRKNLVKIHGETFSDEEKNRLQYSYTYGKHVSFILQCLLEAKHNGADIHTVWKQLFLDEMNGTYHFLKLLEKIHPGSIKIIAPMGIEDVDVKKAAKAMGGNFLSIV